MAYSDRVALKSPEIRRVEPESAVRLMERAGRVRVYAPGQVPFVQGDECRGIYVVCSGLVGLRRSDEDGNSALLGLAGTGDLVGYRAFLSNDAHSNTAEALTLSRVLFIASSDIQRLIDHHPVVRDHIVRKALADLDRSQARCAALLTEGLRTRFIKLLLLIHDSRRPQSGDEPFVLDLPLQRKDIAALIGAAPGSLSRLISELEEEGLIRVDGRRVEFAAAAGTINRSGAPPAPSLQGPNRTVLATLTEARCALLSMIDAEDAAVRDVLNERVQAASARLDALLSKLSGSDARAATEFRTVWEAFKSTRQREIIPAIYAGNLGRAKEIATGVQSRRLAVMKAILCEPTH